MKEIILDSTLVIDERDFQDPTPEYLFGFERTNNFEPITHLESEIIHRNYLDYLGLCWRKHYGVIITPTILWNMVLNNLAYEVNKEPEVYRQYFTESDSKQEILVIQDGNQISVDLLIQKMPEYVPSNILEHTFPKFSTNDENSTMANYTAFLDMVSPYYIYSMYLCGISKIKILGTEEDWNLFKHNCNEISFTIPEFTTYLLTVKDTINKIIGSSTDWENFFKLDKCGSGSEVVVSGWIKDFFIEQPKVSYPENFISCISKIDYHCHNDNKDYRLYAGLFASEREDGYLVPAFDKIYFLNKGVKSKDKEGTITLDLTTETIVKNYIKG